MLQNPPQLVCWYLLNCKVITTQLQIDLAPKPSAIPTPLLCHHHLWVLKVLLLHICLGPLISAFMTHYRQQVPHATITPKLHMLEKHIIPWLNEWKVGLGLMGEQGAESIHALSNSLKRTYQPISNEVESLKCIMKEHYLQVAPSNASALPPPAKRQKKRTSLWTNCTAFDMSSAMCILLCSVKFEIAIMSRHLSVVHVR